MTRVIGRMRIAMSRLCVATWSCTSSHMRPSSGRDAEEIRAQLGEMRLADRVESFLEAWQTKSPGALMTGGATLAGGFTEPGPASTRKVNNPVRPLRPTRSSPWSLTGPSRQVRLPTPRPASDVSTADVAKVVRAATPLPLVRRSDRWCHLSLCVLDAVFARRAQYISGSMATHRYAAFADLEPALAPAVEVSAGRHMHGEQALSQFLANVRGMDSLELAELLKDRQRTSSSGGILKVEAVVRVAQILLDHEVQRLRDVVELLNDPDRRENVRLPSLQCPDMARACATSYLWMLSGDDSYAKADRVVISWLANVLGRPVAVEEAATLLRAAAPWLSVTPWVLVHAVRTTQRRSRR